MRVEVLETQDDLSQVLIGTAELNADGVVVFTGDGEPPGMVMEPDTFEVLEPKDGERYLRAMPVALSGSKVRALLVED